MAIWQKIPSIKRLTTPLVIILRPPLPTHQISSPRKPLIRSSITHLPSLPIPNQTKHPLTQSFITFLIIFIKPASNFLASARAFFSKGSAASFGDCPYTA